MTRFVEPAVPALLEATRRADSEGDAPETGVESAAHSPSGERRSVVVAQLAVETPPPVTLARDGHLLRTVEERPRAHPVALHVCGVQPCAPARGLPRRPVRPLVIDLAPGEALGEPLQVSYDYWWASVTYSERRSCPGTPRG